MDVVCATTKHVRTLSRRAQIFRRIVLRTMEISELSSRGALKRGSVRTTVDFATNEHLYDNWSGWSEMKRMAATILRH